MRGVIQILALSLGGSFLMNQSKQWLTEVNQLCSELGPDDGVDPRLLAKVYAEKRKTHKAGQLCKEALRTVSLVLAGELNDPLLQQLDVVEVSSDELGQFLIVTLVSSNVLESEELIIKERLGAIQGYLRSEIARSVKRKRAPALKFDVVYMQEEGNSHAY